MSDLLRNIGFVQVIQGSALSFSPCFDRTLLFLILSESEWYLRVRPPKVTISKLSYLDHSYPLRGENISDAINDGNRAVEKTSALIAVYLLVSTEEGW
jgi:hypothetical protein